MDTNAVCWRLPTLPQLRSTIGDGRLNCRVRNENGCTPSAKAPTYKIRIESWVFLILGYSETMPFSENGKEEAGVEPATLLSIRRTHVDCDY